MRRERPTEPHERNAPRELHRVPAWMPTAAREVNDCLRAVALRYPDRFVFRDGKLQTKQRELK